MRSTWPSTLRLLWSVVRDKTKELFLQFLDSNKRQFKIQSFWIKTTENFKKLQNSNQQTSAWNYEKHAFLQLSSFVSCLDITLSYVWWMILITTVVGFSDPCVIVDFPFLWANAIGQLGRKERLTYRKLLCLERPLGVGVLADRVINTSK